MMFTGFTSYHDLETGDKRRLTARIEIPSDLEYAVKWLTSLIEVSETVRLEDCHWVCIPKNGYDELIVCNYSFG